MTENNRTQEHMTNKDRFTKILKNQESFDTRLAEISLALEELVVTDGVTAQTPAPVRPEVGLAIPYGDYFQGFFDRRDKAMGPLARQHHRGMPTHLIYPSGQLTLREEELQFHNNAIVDNNPTFLRTAMSGKSWVFMRACKDLEGTDIPLTMVRVQYQRNTVSQEAETMTVEQALQEAEAWAEEEARRKFEQDGPEFKGATGGWGKRRSGTEEVSTGG